MAISLALWRLQAEATTAEPVALARKAASTSDSQASTAVIAAPVAVNDLGWVAWRNDEYVLDLWGLASLQALEARRTYVESAWIEAQFAVKAADQQQLRGVVPEHRLGKDRDEGGDDAAEGVQLAQSHRHELGQQAAHLEARGHDLEEAPPLIPVEVQQARQIEGHDPHRE